jgi:hypothetical protein
MRKIALALLLLAPMAACAETSEEVVADEYVDGEQKLTDDGAFEVVLYNEDGAVQVGENTFYLRVAMPNPGNPRAQSKGIPHAKIALDAYMPNDALSMDVVPEITYLGDGEYMIEGVVLEEAGTWQFDFEIAVGMTIRESVSFAFEI